MKIDDKNSDAIRDAIKQKIKEKIKKELLEEVYTELQLEELQEEITDEILEAKNIDHTEDINTRLDPIPMEPVITIAKSDKSDAKIKITVKAILKIASHSLKYANSNIRKESWVEVIGLLAGKYDKSNGILHIDDAYPMGHGTAVYAEIKDYNNFTRAYEDIVRSKQFICGWYHSHPGLSCFMSSQDLGTQARYQNLWKNAVALVIDPSQINGRSLGFEIYRANLKTKKWYSLPFNVKGDLDKRLFPTILDIISDQLEF